MLVLIFLALILAGSIALIKWNDGYNTFYDLVGWLFSIGSGFVLLICTIGIIISYVYIESDITKYNTMKSEIQRVRSDTTISDIERAELFKIILDYNKELAQSKYWNNTIFDLFIPDTLTKLEPLK